MKHNGDQWNGMTNEDLVEFEKHMEQENKKIDWEKESKKPFIPKDSNPPF